MNKASDCNKYKYVRMYDSGKKIYYCNHEGRTNDMGKLGIGELPKEKPEWCPLQIKKQGYDSVLGFIGGNDDCVFTNKPIEYLGP